MDRYRGARQGSGLAASSEPPSIRRVRSASTVAEADLSLWYARSASPWAKIPGHAVCEQIEGAMIHSPSLLLFKRANITLLVHCSGKAPLIHGEQIIAGAPASIGITTVKSRTILR
jgi:hypothetical protein